MTGFLRLRLPARRRLLPPLAALLAVALGAGVAWAYWISTGNGAGSAAAGGLNAASHVTASSGAGTSTVSLSWAAAATSATAVAPSGYYVTRIASDNSTAAACATSPDSTSTATSCTDTAVPDGAYQYVVTAVFHTWTATSTRSNSVTVSSTRPSVTVNQASTQADPTNGAPIQFTAVFSEPVVDFTAASVTISGTAPGAKTVTVSGTGPTYTISVGGMTGTGSVTASIPASSVHDAAGAGNTASTSTDDTVTFDVTAAVAPVPGAAAAVTFGSAPLYVSNEVVTFTDAATDADSGVKTVSYYRCPGTVGSCTATTGTLIGTSSTATGHYPVNAPAPLGSADGTYTISAVVTDNAGNVTTSTAVLVDLDTIAPTASRPTVNGNS